MAIENSELEKSQVFVVGDILAYCAHSVAVRPIIQKTTGSVSVVALDGGKTLDGKVSPFDTFIQVIDGQSEIVIDGKYHLLAAGQSIIIPAHSRSTIKAKERCKMISTVIKSGYEDVL